MIVVTIDLVSALNGRKTQLGQMVIANKGGTQKRGDYDVMVLRKGASLTDSLVGKIKPTRRGEVLDYPRLSYNVWRLIARALKSAFPEEA